MWFNGATTFEDHKRKGAHLVKANAHYTPGTIEHNVCLDFNPTGTHG
jgi:hypothetical protein